MKKIKKENEFEKLIEQACQNYENHKKISSNKKKSVDKKKLTNDKKK